MAVPAGSIRFNTDSSKLEIHNGEKWWEIDSTSPAEQTGGTRGVIAVGADNTTYVVNIQYINVDTTGNATDFGDSTQARGYGASWSSRTRGCFAAGQNSGNKNVIDYVTLSSTGDAIDFGDITDELVRYPAGLSDATRGLLVGGYPGASAINNLRYVTIASTGDTVDFGDMISATYGDTCATSPTRGIICHGHKTSPSTRIVDIEYITISTTGNGADFGDNTQALNGMLGCSNAVRGIFAGGYLSGGIQNAITYITMSTLGDAIDFGDITSTRGYGAGVSSPTRAVFCGGGHYPSVYGIETIDYVQIATTGNAIDFGDFVDSMEPLGAMGCSNGHGGLG